MKKKRILLKLSGEALSGSKDNGIDFERVIAIAKEVKECLDMGFSIAIVVGGGNFWRGKANDFMERQTSDYIGMLATTMNALALQDAFKQIDVPVRVETAIEMRKVAEFYIREKCEKHLEKGRVVIFGCGTGNPFFSTDTAAALRAAEINADILVKATNVDGIYDKDPKKYKDAKLIKETTYNEVLNKKLKVMDLTAITLCMEEAIPIIVFNINKPGMLKQALITDDIGSIVK
ncbi:MAG TPA: UMP kinase [Candidatus Onthousia excrementipullorum]|uniref:Uridylate kinase n=1 Tax=Candidatus Onthousia excrementipullorum TaxID=2840884 RepID=A0A9D1DV80_9FIRM|nr:UMP kinase [Candidatus Onthousia excrementipullorum]